MEILHTDKCPQAVGPYSQAVKVGNLIYCSGQIPIDPKTNELRLGSIKEQTTQVMENVKAFCESQNLSLNSVVKSMIFLTDMEDFAAVNEVYSSYFTSHLPARSCVAVKELPKKVSVEVEVILSLE